MTEADDDWLLRREQGEAFDAPPHEREHYARLEEMLADLPPEAAPDGLDDRVLAQALAARAASPMPDLAWTPRRLITRALGLVHTRRAVLAASFIAALAIIGALTGRWFHVRAQRAAEASRRDRDLGHFTLTLAPFEWRRDPATGAPVAVAIDARTLPALTWTLHDPAPDDHDEPGNPVSSDVVRHRPATLTPGVLREDVEARGGDAFLLVDGRGRPGEACAPSIVRLRRIPGYVHRRGPPAELRVAVPTCAATRFDTVEIPAGPFVFGGDGDPPMVDRALGAPLAERTIALDRFWIDRTEITNGAFALFAAMSSIHDVSAVTYTGQLAAAAGPSFPRAALDWFDARAYCRFLGKELPTSAQWQKALRGGLVLPGGSNPAPRRNMAWIGARTPMPAAVALPTAAAVGTHPEDMSPYGVLDLTGNLQEWTDDVDYGGDPALPIVQRPRITRGGNWSTTADELLAYLVIEEARPPGWRSFFNGARCASAR